MYRDGGWHGQDREECMQARRDLSVDFPVHVSRIERNAFYCARISGTCVVCSYFLVQVRVQVQVLIKVFAQVQVSSQMGARVQLDVGAGAGVVVGTKAGLLRDRYNGWDPDTTGTGISVM